MRRLVQRHEMLRCLPKLMALVFALAGALLGQVNFMIVTTADGDWLSAAALRLLQVCVYISAALVFTLPSAGRRCRPWELTLPLGGRILWRAHRHALLLGGILMMLVYAPVPILLWHIFGDAPRFLWLDPGDLGLLRLCWELWGLPLVFWIMTVDLVTGWWTDQAHPGAVPEWKSNIFGLTVFMALALLAVSSFGLDLWVIWLPLPVAWWNLRRHVPDGLLLPDGLENSPPGEMDNPRSGRRGHSRWMAHRLIIRTVFKWPAHWLAMPIMAVLYGMFLSGNSPIGGASALLRFGHIFLAAYMLVAGAGFLLEKLHQVDHLPISRGLILGWLVWPLLGGIVLGYGVGHLHQRLTGDPVERIAFQNDSEGYGLKVPSRIFEVARTSEVPDIVAPWGERHQPESRPVFKGLPWMIYKPYSTPEGASLRFVRWQLARAIEATYGQAWEEQGLFHVEDGRVQVRAEGLRLAADHPRWRPLPLGPVFPVLVMAVLLAFYPGLILLLVLLRRQTSLMRTRVAFWCVMGLYMALHLGGVGLFIAGWSDDWIVEGVVLGFLSRPGSLTLGFKLLVYVTLGMVALGGFRVACRQFGKLEACR